MDRFEAPQEGQRPAVEVIWLGQALLDVLGLSESREVAGRRLLVQVLPRSRSLRSLFFPLAKAD